MTPHAFHETLDKIVPWLAFAYGAVMILVLSQPKLIQLANERLPEPHRSRFLAHGPLAWICLFVGATWILQGLWGF
ncbi:MAG: hypothetical protein J0L82_01750 [Deltaproteobacteria bacterium]|jgi:hypothetical protein|nr:hypothetical protein [Deltaproteobacteria bacterium]